MVHGQMERRVNKAKHKVSRQADRYTAGLAERQADIRRYIKTCLHHCGIRCLNGKIHQLFKCDVSGNK